MGTELDVIARIAAQRVVPVIRAADAREACSVARACHAGGMDVVELTTTVPGVELALRQLTREGLIVGLGTVIDAQTVSAAVAAGARFVVSFTNPPGFVFAAHEAGVVAIPGALTPTEIAVAVRDGADAVKLFPAASASCSYLRSVRTLIPDLRLLATGGIPAELEAIGQWLDAGAFAVGLGGLAVPPRNDSESVTGLVHTILSELRR